MWLRKGSDVTSDSEIRHPFPPGCQGPGDVHPPETVSSGWGIDGTASAVAGPMPPEAKEPVR